MNDSHRSILRLELFLLTLLISLSVVPLLCASDDIPHQLSALQQKTFLIRGFYSDDALEYDSSGNVTGEPKAGSWTTALFKIKKIDTNGLVMLQGSRVYIQFDQRSGVFRTVQPKGEEPVRLTIEIDPANFPTEQLASVLQRIFVQRLDPEQDLPEYWHDFFANQVHQHKIADTSIIDRSRDLRKAALQRARDVDTVQSGVACDESVSSFLRWFFRALSVPPVTPASVISFCAV